MTKYILTLDIAPEGAYPYSKTKSISLISDSLDVMNRLSQKCIKFFTKRDLPFNYFGPLDDGDGKYCAWYYVYHNKPDKIRHRIHDRFKKLQTPDFVFDIEEKN